MSYKGRNHTKSYDRKRPEETLHKEEKEKKMHTCSKT